jgi:hypothetical protein
MTLRARLREIAVFALIMFGACAQGQPAKKGAASEDLNHRPDSVADSSSESLREEAALGVRIAIPEGWHRSDLSEGGVHVLVFSPTEENLSTRISLLMFPGFFLPDGIATREAHLKMALGEKYKRLRLEPAVQGSLRGEVLEYETIGDAAHRTVEYSARRGEEVLIVQFSSPAAEWEQASALARRTLATLDIGVPKAALSFPVEEEETAPPEQFQSDVRIDSHSIDVRIQPGTGAFEAVDRLTLTAPDHDVSEAQFLISKFQSVSVEDRQGALRYELRDFGGDGGVQKLVVELREKLRRGRSAEITVRVSTDKYEFRIKNSPVGGYHILGQVAKASSFSSHVFYYPVDGENRAKATFRFHVPVGYVAVGPGKLVRQRRAGSTMVYEWSAADGFVKQLPYGWAVAKYTLLEGRSRSKVPIRVYALPEHAGRGKNVLRVATDVVDFYEQRFGPFPFGGVSTAEVRPIQGIAGVSLPSMVLLSAELFNGAESYEVIRDIEAAFQGPLVIADELSHQYNFYSVALPNQLSEGIAQYTSSLFAEHISGVDLGEHFDYYSRIYRSAVATSPDHPIMSDAVYSTPAYMGIVFSKSACVLHMLRGVVGDDAFFRSLRRLFRDYLGRKAGLDDLQRVFEAEAGAKLSWFFDQWYRRAGYPKLEVTWRQRDSDLLVTIKQAQDGEPFRVPVTLAVTEGRGTREVEVEITQKSHDLSVPVQGKVEAIAIGRARPVLAEVSIVAGRE